MTELAFRKMKKTQIRTISNKLAEIDFLEQYNSGKTKFNQAKLENINLESKLLLRLELAEANLNYANFEKSILIDTNLSRSSLIEAKMKATNLDRVDLSAANLSNANLCLARFNKVNLTRACLIGVFFYSAHMNNVDLSFSNLCGASLNDIDLGNVRLKGAYYNDNTCFPDRFNPANAGMVHESNIESIDSLITRFNLICGSSNRYLGNVITAKFLNSSRPNIEWFNQFKINKDNQIVFQGELSERVNLQEVYYFKTWIDLFVRYCSKIVRNFDEFI